MVACSSRAGSIPASTIKTKGKIMRKAKYAVAIATRGDRDGEDPILAWFDCPYAARDRATQENERLAREWMKEKTKFLRYGVSPKVPFRFAYVSAESLPWCSSIMPEFIGLSPEQMLERKRTLAREASGRRYEKIKSKR